MKEKLFVAGRRRLPHQATIRHLTGTATSTTGLLLSGTLSVGTLNCIVTKFILTICEGSPDDLNGSGVVLREPSLRRRNARHTMTFCRAMVDTMIAGSRALGSMGTEENTAAITLVTTATLRGDPNEQKTD